MVEFSQFSDVFLEFRNDWAPRNLYKIFLTNLKNLWLVKKSSLKCFNSQEIFVRYFLSYSEMFTSPEMFKLPRIVLNECFPEARNALQTKKSLWDIYVWSSKMFGLLITLLNKCFSRARSSLQTEKCLIPQEFFVIYFLSMRNVKVLKSSRIFCEIFLIKLRNAWHGQIS